MVVFSSFVSGKYGKSGKIPTLTMSRFFSIKRESKNCVCENLYRCKSQKLPELPALPGNPCRGSPPAYSRLRLPSCTATPAPSPRPKCGFRRRAVRPAIEVLARGRTAPPCHACPSQPPPRPDGDTVAAPHPLNGLNAEMCFRSHRQIPTTGSLLTVDGIAANFFGSEP